MIRVLILGLFCSLFYLSSFSQSTHIKNGIEYPGPDPETELIDHEPSRVLLLGASDCITFDNTSEPCSFMLSLPLSSEFIGQGVTFSGPDPLDGGAVLDQCGNFGVTAHSPPNFLAFNTGATLSNGGHPIGPETITFSNPVKTFSLNVGHLSSGQVTVTAYNSSNTLVDQDMVSPNSVLQFVQLDGSDITSVEIAFTGPILVVDDICWINDVQLIVPTLGEWALILLSLLLLIVGVVYLHGINQTENHASSL